MVCHRQVQVYHLANDCRHFSEKGRKLGWKSVAVPAPPACAPALRRSFKDRAMAQIADVAVAFWDNRSLGTVCNVHAMLRQGKRVKLYRHNSAVMSYFVMLRNLDDWRKLLADLTYGEREACERRIAQMDRLLSQAGGARSSSNTLKILR